MTKKVRIWIVTSAVWLIVLLITLINKQTGITFGTRSYTRQDVLIDYLLWGILPVVIGWGIWWIRRR